MSETDKIRKKYDRFSKVYDRYEATVERLLFSKWRAKYISYLEGQVLEVGVGTGKNLPYYSSNAQVTGIDFSQGMLDKAIKRLSELDKPNIDLEKQDAQHLPYPDNHFDYVVTTFVLCSIPDPVKALEEIKRVLKPGGQMISLEHVLSNNWFIALHEHVMNPFTRYLFGYNVNRNTYGNIRRAGFSKVEQENLMFYDVFRKLVATK